MKTKILNYWESIRTSYWFVPTVMAALATLVAALTLHIDQNVLSESSDLLSWLYTGGPEGVRNLLSTLAGSMITMASLIFSITIVALTLASSQFGPRLLNNFMRDTGNQVVMGTFIATFIFSILVLRTVRSLDDNLFVPHLSVTVAILLALASLALLIFFIHHVSVSIQVENVIASVESDLNDAIERLFPQEKSRAEYEYALRDEKDVPEAFEEEAQTILSDESGYLQTIDNEGLMELATEQNLLLELVHRPGDFIAADNLLARTWSYDGSEDDLSEKVNEAFILGAQRRRLQDVEYAIDQLVEIAVRALSPGINDPFTAIACVDRLGVALANLAEREIPSGYRYDEEGRLRLITDSITFGTIVHSAFDEIRQYGLGDRAVSIRLLETIALVGAHARSEADREALLRQAKMVRRGADEALAEEWDREDVRTKYKQAERVIRKSRHVAVGVVENEVEEVDSE